jgi:hypothetical protein
MRFWFSGKFSPLLLAALLLSLPFERIPSLEASIAGFDVTIRVSQLILVLLGVHNLAPLWQARRQLLAAPWRYLWLFNFVVLLSALASLSLTRGLMVSAFTLFCSVSAFVIAQTIDLSALERYRKYLFAGALVVCAIALYQFFGDLLGLSTSWTLLRERYTAKVFGFPRVQAASLEPLYFGNYLLIPALLAAGHWLWQKRFGWVQLVVFFTIIFITLSRGSIAGLVAGVALLAGITLYRRQLPRALKLVGLTSLSVVVALGLIAVGGGLDLSNETSASTNVSNFSNQATNIDSGGSVDERAITRRLAGQAFTSSPLIGIGPGNFGAYATKQDPTSFDKTTIVNNEPLEIAAETGAAGILTLLAFGLSLFMATLRAASQKLTNSERIWLYSLLAVVLAFGVQYQTFSTLYVTHIWVTLGLLAGLATRAGKHHEA